MVDSVEWFVADLAREPTSALVNEHAIEVPVLDRPGGAAIRCANLRAYLVEPPAFVEYAAEPAPDVQAVPTAVDDVAGWEA